MEIVSFIKKEIDKTECLKMHLEALKKIPLPGSNIDFSVEGKKLAQLEIVENRKKIVGYSVKVNLEDLALTEKIKEEYGNSKEFLKGIKYAIQNEDKELFNCLYLMQSKVITIGL